MTKQALLFYICWIAILTNMAKGCHFYNYNERRKRDLEVSDDDSTVQLRAYFAACMNVMLPSPEYDWDTAVDFTVLESLWHLNTVEVYCSGAGEGSTKECWQEQLGNYLISDSEVLPRAQECVAHYSQDQSAGTNRYDNELHRKKRQAVLSSDDGELHAYARCLSETHDTGATSYEKLSIFVNNHTKDNCDSSAPASMRGRTTWPYRFVSLTRPDSRLRNQLNTCGKQFFPPPPFWSTWSGWGGCQPSCGEGRQSRFRSCRSGPDPKYESEGCPGIAQQARQCIGIPCPSWSRWSEWTLCQSTCGQGITYRTRHCRSGITDLPGELCPGPYQQRHSCFIRQCPSDATWSAWEAWSSCPCGGTLYRTRNRACTGSGHSSIFNQSNRNCRGDAQQSEHCEELESYSEWGAWTACSYNCMQLRTRHCRTETSTGSRTQLRTCRTDLCQLGPASWGSWSPYSSCRTQQGSGCGSGRKTRRRLCRRGTATVTSTLCVGSANDVRTCTVAC